MDSLYFHNFFGYSASRAASMSAVFPAVGAPSVLIAGWVSDKLGVTGRSMITFAGLAGTVAALMALASLPRLESSSAIPLTLVGLVAFCLLGPYSYLAGAFALDFGGRQASAAASGIIDGVGYLGGVLAGYGAARVSVRFGWHGVFVTLAIVSALSALAAGYLFFHQSMQIKKKRAVCAAVRGAMK